MNRIATTLVLALCAACCACSIETPPNVRTVQAANLPARLGIDAAGPEDEAASDQSQRFIASLSAALATRGIVIDQASTQRLAVGVSARPSAVGIRSAVAGNSGPPPRGHHLFDRCSALRTEAVVALRDTGSGSSSGRWRASFDSCRATPASLDRLADAVAQALKPL